MELLKLSCIDDIGEFHSCFLCDVEHCSSCVVAECKWEPETAELVSHALAFCGLADAHPIALPNSFAAIQFWYTCGGPGEG